MALKVVVSVLLASALVACGGSTGGPRSAADDPRIDLDNIPDFQDIGLFPGYLSGFGASLTGFYLRDALPCLNIDPSYVENVDALEMLTIDDLDVTDEVMLIEDESYISYCFNPFPREGVYTIDIALRTRDSLEYYRFDFINNRGPSFPLSAFPGEITGLQPVDNSVRDEFANVLTEDAQVLVQPLCVDAPAESSTAPGIEDLVWFNIDGRSINPDRVSETRLGDDIRRFCFNDVDLEPGLHLLEIQLIVSPSFPPGTNIYQGDVVVVE